MNESSMQTPSFNLWHEPWITVEREGSALVEVSIEQALRNAQNYRSLYDPSPPVIVGIHRLLVAILQDLINPRTNLDLAQVWRNRMFADKSIQAFGEAYSQRFDLYSVVTPFFQSADLPLRPPKKPQKYVVELMDEVPSGTAVRHYNHIAADEYLFCSKCAAKGLVLIPAFSKASGSGYRTSITGVPPLYVLPGGDTLFASLAASLVNTSHQPDVARPAVDMPWWKHPPVVEAKKEVNQLGYVQSLTFPSRRVRLHPEKMVHRCDRCGNQTEWGVSSIHYEMGESRPKASAFWQDPFVAYKPPSKQKKSSEPSPVYLPKGKDIWREFGALFLSPERSVEGFRRPLVLEQITTLQNQGIIPDEDAYPFTVIGMLIEDMKAKVAAWNETGFAVPPRVLRDPHAAFHIENSIEFAEGCATRIHRTFRQYFGGDSSHSQKHQHLRQLMVQQYWGQLAEPFRQFVLMFQPQSDLDALFHNWLKLVEQQALESFLHAAESVGDDAASLRQRVQANDHCRNALKSYRQKTHPKE